MRSTTRLTKNTSAKHEARRAPDYLTNKTLNIYRNNLAPKKQDPTKENSKDEQRTTPPKTKPARQTPMPTTPIIIQLGVIAGPGRRNPTANNSDLTNSKACPTKPHSPTCQPMYTLASCRTRPKIPQPAKTKKPTLQTTPSIISTKIYPWRSAGPENQRRTLQSSKTEPTITWAV